MSALPKVVGIGLNKTGTKTLGSFLRRWGYRNRSYDSNTVHSSPSFDLYAAGREDALLESMDAYDSFEDWPWPLLFRRIDERYPDARFVLTVRASEDVWFRSLCNMAVRLGPFPLYERLVYGASMPQGHREQYVRVYREHNAAVTAHFADRPGKLLTLCWDNGDDASTLANFLGLEGVDTTREHVNASPPGIYDGDSLWRAHAHRLVYQRITGPKSPGRRVVEALKRRLPGA